jgi:hypothetical protein
MEAPKRAKLLIASEEPIITMSKMETADPIRAKLRIAIELPK